MAASNAPSPAGARQPDALLGWMESLADPTRLRLLRLLERHELGVAALCHVLQLPQSTVSRHLKVLADQGWVVSRGQRTTNLYRMETTDAAARKLWQLARDQTDGWATISQDHLRLTRLLADRQPAAQAFFAGAAGQWDRLRDELYGRSFGREALLALLPAGWTVADLELRRGSLEALPLDTASCQGALLLLALTYVADPSVAVREAGRILRPGGRLVVVDLLRHDRDDFRREMGQVRLGFDLDELCSMMGEAGLVGVSVRALAPEPQAKGPALALATGSAVFGDWEAFGARSAAFP
jgi:ArsR family transcriptional regulator